MKQLFTLVILLTLTSCTSPSLKQACSTNAASEQCPDINAKSSEKIAQLHKWRDWTVQISLDKRSIDYGIDVETPELDGLIKVVGTSVNDGHKSLAAKIYMIENAQHTIDASYYIFTRDLIGYAFLGALCDAIKRGVDVRLMVDSVGSFHTTHSELKALNTCAKEAGMMRNNEGEITPYRARAQVGVFNAVSKVFTRVNRRSHDKLLVVDGHFPNKGIAITGGRNISLDYYGLTADGKVDEDAFQDLEIILKAGNIMASIDSIDSKITPPFISELYLSLLFMHDGNKQLTNVIPYKNEIDKSNEALAKLKAMPLFARQYEQMSHYLTEGFTPSTVRLAHELSNLKHNNVVSNREEILDSNPNSIVALLRKLGKEYPEVKHVKVVTPYVFLPEYTTPTGKIRYDGREQIDLWLAKDPERTLEIITNSVLTSDNFLAQSIIDLDACPRTLLSPELLKWWQKDVEDSEWDQTLINSKEWREQINNPRVKVYQLGKIDSVLLGGDTNYGKLHAKFIVTNVGGFVGTSNLDYRSRLYNNEMGFFFTDSAETTQALNDQFDRLKKNSYLWGSPQWLNLRNMVRSIEGIKGDSARRQRKTYTNIMITGLKWQI